jgi:hypothetical protein
MDGCFDCFKYVHKNGCEWNDNTYCNAMKEDFLNCLIYAHDNRCDFDTSSFENISEYHYKCNDQKKIIKK